MAKRQSCFIFLVSTLIFFLWPSSDGVSQVRSIVPRNRGTTTPAVEKLSFCQEVEVSKAGVVCESSYGFTARLDFPPVDVERVLSGAEVFPRTEARFSAENQVIQGVLYRNIIFVLRWESTTPDFLQVYLADILPGWGGNGIPYRLLWRSNYETCAVDGCVTWTQVKDRGEYLPLDIPDLPDNLAADSNFNGVPASFWNTNLTTVH